MGKIIPPATDYIGKIFGKLTVVRFYRTAMVLGRKEHLWLCHCSCDGREHITESDRKSVV